MVTRREFLNVVPAATLLSTAALGQSAGAPDSTWSLWYRVPAARWLDSLPVGNGRLGAMVFGGIEKETLALNESTVWSGAPNAASDNPTALEYLGEMRQLLFDGKYAEANALARTHLAGRENSYGTHLPMAHLVLDFGPGNAAPTDYKRSLDLENGIARVEYTAGGTQWTREVFASNPGNVIALRISASKPGAVSCSITLDPKDLPAETHIRRDNTLVLMGSAWEKRHSDGKSGVNFQTSLRVLPEGGTLTANASALQVKDANAVVLLIAANTNYGNADFPGLCDRQIAGAVRSGYKALRDAHVADHKKLFGRVAIDLGGADAALRPTDERLAAVGSGSADPNLSAVFFQYGRYLLIAGSREDSPLPMNLQGIWNDNLAANMVWTCDFHLDINTQQNYWHSEICNLPECGEPLFKLLESMSRHGRGTARNMYGASGWVAHVYTNAWGFTAPGVGLGWGPFVTGGVWTAAHLWEHYLFTRDRSFLAQRAYPVLKGAAEFFLDYMVEHPAHKWLVTGPSLSPENQYLSPDGKRCSVAMGPTCDQALVSGLFTSCIEASTTLNIDAPFRAKLVAANARLAPLQIGKHGQLQEWLEDFEEASPNHRHTSHLVALYPLDQITPEKTPALAKAARVTLDRRLGQKNWEDVEWSRANLINFYARLQDGDSAHKHVVGLLREDTDKNLMTFSRAGIAGARDNIFAIDGNTAGAAGIAEMLLQSHDDIHLLPALPAAWPAGSVSGLRARGGWEVSLRWSNGALNSVTVKSLTGGKQRLRYGKTTASVDLKPGATATFNGQLR